MTASPRLTPELENNILAAIRAGGFADVAAAAFGVSRPLFHKWLRWGKHAKNGMYQAFAHKVAQAQATARLSAEMQAHQKDPRMWLRAGPGRETTDSQGWTTFVRPQARQRPNVDPFTAPAFVAFLATLRATLTPYPEALEAVVAAIDKARPTPGNGSPKGRLT
jgi:hypothetical protein